MPRTPKEKHSGRSPTRVKPQISETFKAVDLALNELLIEIRRIFQMQVPSITIEPLLTDLGRLPKAKKVLIHKWLQRNLEERQKRTKGPLHKNPQLIPLYVATQLAGEFLERPVTHATRISLPMPLMTLDTVTHQIAEQLDQDSRVKVELVELPEGPQARLIGDEEALIWEIAGIFLDQMNDDVTEMRNDIRSLITTLSER